MKPFFVYMLRCSDGSYYVGHTDELEHRVACHQSGQIEGYTQRRRPVELVWCQETATREEALVAELRVKGWSRAKKEALIAEDWEQIQELARSRTGLRQAQPERGGAVARASAGNTASEPPISVRPEPVEGPAQAVQGLRQAQPERGGVDARTSAGNTASEPPISVRPEPVEGPARAVQGLRQAQPERGGAVARASAGNTAGEPTTSVRPEPVEGPARASPEQDLLVTRILAADRRAIAKTITLLESTRPDHRARADTLLNNLLPHTGKAMRLGISGVPGVGKSTFIETLGLALIAQGHRVAVLAIDPSSSVSGGSILGDKTRMERLSVSEHAYIRPSPASGTLGGVAEKTREAMLVCEAAGYDVVIVETVGVGQSETAVASMTDMFVLLQLPNAGDDLQAIKKGVMELADLVVINKADIDPDAATRAEATITSAMRLLNVRGQAGHWTPKVMRLSALKGDGIAAFWSHVEQFHQQRRAGGEFDARRKKQALSWMWDLIHARLQADFRHHPAVRRVLHDTVTDVAEARTTPSSAARALLDLFERS